MVNGLSRDADVNKISSNGTNSLDFKTGFDSESALRALFKQIIFVECLDSQPQNRSMSNTIMVNFVPGLSPDVVLVEFSNTLSHLIWKLCDDSHANTNDQSRDQVNRHICKILNENIPISKDASELCNMKGLGPIEPPLLLPSLVCDSSQRKYEDGKQDVVDMLVWIREVVALDPGGMRMTQSFDFMEHEERKWWKLVLSTRQFLHQKIFANQKEQTTLKTQIKNTKVGDKLNSEKRKSQRNLNLPTICKNSFERKRIPIGKFFQASLPKWTGLRTRGMIFKKNKVFDKRWTGFTMWPVNGIRMLSSLPNEIGKGRDDACSCLDRDSKRCIRYHIKMARLRLQSELGDAFIGMGFNNITQNVSKSLISKQKIACRASAKVFFKV